jgi:glutaredoxin 3
MTKPDVTIYSKPACPSCVKAKGVLKNMGVAFTEKTIGTDIQPAELFQLFEDKGLPAPRTAPQIFIGEQCVGGYEQLLSYIEDTGFNGTGYAVGQ